MASPDDKYLISPWNPLVNSVIDLKHLGKLAEELGELSACVSRCIIQGVEESEPVTKKPNRQWLEEEIADVLANMGLVAQHFKLNREDIHRRAKKKESRLKKWYQELYET